MPGRKTTKAKAKAKAKPQASKSQTNGANIGSLRETLGLTQQEFATVLGLSTVSISRWEHKHTRPTDASRALLGLLARALKRRPSRLTEIVTTLRGISGTDELDRIVALVHLGD